MIFMKIEQNQSDLMVRGSLNQTDRLELFVMEPSNPNGVRKAAFFRDTAEAEAAAPPVVLVVLAEAQHAHVQHRPAALGVARLASPAALRVARIRAVAHLPAQGSIISLVFLMLCNHISGVLTGVHLYQWCINDAHLYQWCFE